MSQWNSSTPEQRIFDWRTFRNQLQDLSFDQQLEKVAKYFFDCPIGKSRIDCYEPNSWPTPWEILSDRDYCVNSISILMYDTLNIINIDSTKNLKLCLVQEGSEIFLVLVANNNSILNYEAGKVSTWPAENLTLLFEHNIDIRQYQ